MDVLATVRACGATSQGLATARALRAAGLSSGSLAAAVADGTVTRVHRRVYAAAALPRWTAFVVTESGVAEAYVAHVRASLLSLGPGAVATGRTAAALYGWPLLIEPARTVEAAVPHGSRRTRLKHVRLTERRRLPELHLVVLPGTDPVPVATAVDTILECARTLPQLQAVVVCDSALRSGRVTLRELEEASRALSGVRAARRIRRVLELCDPASESVLESVLRVRLLLAGVTRFATQQVLRNAEGRHVLRADFVFEEARLVVEADGSKWHQDPVRDRGRDNALAIAGWRVLRFGWADIVHDAERVVAEIQAALRTGDGQSASAQRGLAA